ncbi:hypothetical protein D3C77_578020 [compost metagenome]
MLDLLQGFQAITGSNYPLRRMSGPVVILGLLLLGWPHFAIGQAPSQIDVLTIQTSVQLANVGARHGRFLADQVEAGSHIANCCVLTGADGQLTDAFLACEL